MTENRENNFEVNDFNYGGSYEMNNDIHSETKKTAQNEHFFKKNFFNVRDDYNKNLQKKKAAIQKAIAEFKKKNDSAIEYLKDFSEFKKEILFQETTLNCAARAMAFNYDDEEVKRFFDDVKMASGKSKAKGGTFWSEWKKKVQNIAAELRAENSDLQDKDIEIAEQLESFEFISAQPELQNFIIPRDFYISKDGVKKIVGKNMLIVCRKPIFIIGKIYDVDNGIYKLVLAYFDNGKLKEIAPQESNKVLTAREITKFAALDFPVSSANAQFVVDYLDAFKVANEDNLQMSKMVSHCGWYDFNGEKYFIDPRRKNEIVDDGKKIPILINSSSNFSQSLKMKGNLEEWKKAYALCKYNPKECKDLKKIAGLNVARFIVAASVATPLLEILGERNFALYVYTATAAGKTTALYLGASTFGDEKVIRSFDATKNGLIGAAADVTGYAYLIDEKQAIDKKFKEQFQQFFYSLGNGKGRTRLNKDSSVQEMQDFQTIAIMTAETKAFDDTVTGGANTRCLQIHAPKIILDRDTCKQIRDRIKNNYGVIFPRVIDRYIDYGFEELRELYAEILAFFKEAGSFENILPEYQRYIAVITIADMFLNMTLGEEETMAKCSACSLADSILRMTPFARKGFCKSIYCHEKKSILDSNR